MYEAEMSQRREGHKAANLRARPEGGGPGSHRKGKHLQATSPGTEGLAGTAVQGGSGHVCLLVEDPAGLLQNSWKE